MRILVSACLLGQNCKYDGGNNYSEKLAEFLKGHEIFPVCPEVLGGLPVPRKPGEIVNGAVLNKDGHSVDSEYRAGAAAALKTAIENHVDCAVLKSRSPSCGVKQIYDGTFSGTLIDGQGVTAKLLKENGIKVIDVEDI